jgi:Domain of unknown function (DUF4124)
MNRRSLSVLSLALWSVVAAAQTPIYESKDKGGTVFSDQPAPGAKKVDLPPPNVVQTAKPASAAPKASAAAPPPYGRLAIVSPENEGTVHSNDGAFQLQVRAQPALRAGSGDRFRVKLDGKPLAQGYAAGVIDIKSADWARAAAPDTIEHVLQVTIVDRSGAVLIESAPVKFFVHRATR